MPRKRKTVLLSPKKRSVLRAKTTRRLAATGKAEIRNSQYKPGANANKRRQRSLEAILRLPGQSDIKMVVPNFGPRAGGRKVIRDYPPEQYPLMKQWEDAICDRRKGVSSSRIHITNPGPEASKKKKSKVLKRKTGRKRAKK